MNPALACLVSELTLDQAVAELAAIFDAAPDESDQLARYHWQQNNTVRARQLEAHIARLQQLADHAAPEPTPARPDPEPATTQETPMRKLKKEEKTIRWTPQKRFDTAVTKARANLELVRQAPTDRKLRQKVQVILSESRKVARETGFDFPLDLVLPDLPNPHQGKAATTPQREPQKMADKPGPGPYVPPTGEDILAALGQAPAEPTRAEMVAENLAQFREAVEKVIQEPARPPCAEDCTHPAHHHDASTADLDARDRTISRRTAPEQYATPCDALETLRRIRRDTWLLLVQLADLEPAERPPYRPGLQAVIVGCESGLDLVDEADMAEGA